MGLDIIRLSELIRQGRCRKGEQGYRGAGDLLIYERTVGVTYFDNIL
jgi:hypothetical protein